MADIDRTSAKRRRLYNAFANDRKTRQNRTHIYRIWTATRGSALESRQLQACAVPMGWAGTPEDIKGAALLMCSNAGRYITGPDLLIDDGMLLRPPD